MSRNNFLYSREKLKNKLSEIEKLAKKSLGQNYLVDKNVIDKIIEFVQVELIKKNQNQILEIGCGMGALTNVFLERNIKVLGVEIDHKSASFLNELFFDEINRDLFFLLKQDFLTIEIKDISFFLRDDFFIVGNLPYNITTPALLNSFVKFFQYSKNFIFMIQTEVISRVTAKIGDKNYGPLSVMSHLFCEEIKVIMNVSHSCFYPMPKVQSSVVYFKLRKDILNLDYNLFYNIVLRSFNMRRKKIFKSLLKSQLGNLNCEILKNIVHKKNEMKDKRAQELSFKDYLEFYYIYLSYV